MTELCFASRGTPSASGNGKLNSLIPSPVTHILPSYNPVFLSFLGAPSIHDRLNFFPPGPRTGTREGVG